jgi:hypothetical protein
MNFIKDKPVNIHKWYSSVETELKLPIRRSKSGTTHQYFTPEQVYNHLVKNNWIFGMETFNPSTPEVEDPTLLAHLFEY